jgi:hypothetical protein
MDYADFADYVYGKWKLGGMKDLVQSGELGVVTLA